MSEDSCCSIYSHTRILLLTSQSHLCPFCYEICRKAEQPIIIEYHFDSSDRCTCNHEENAQFFRECLSNNFQNFPEKSLRNIIALNFLLALKKQNTSLLEIISPEVPSYLTREYELLKANKFRWEDIDISLIEASNELLLFFNKPIPSILISILNTKPFEQFFPLKFLDLFSEKPNNWFGEAVYNRSLDFYSSLFELFQSFFLEKDLRMFEKLDAEELHTYSLIARRAVREKNQNLEALKNKYPKEIIDLKTFAIKLIDKFIHAATWRWIGTNHTAHIYAIKLSKTLIEYQLLAISEIEEIIHMLFLKINAFRSLELAIKRDSGVMDLDIVMIWREGLMNIREYCAEILLHYCYQRLDQEFVEKGSQIKGFFEEKETILEFREFIFGYLLNPVTINIDDMLISPKTMIICTEILQIFGCKNDEICLSLEDLPENSWEKIPNSLDDKRLKVFNDFSREFSKLLAKISMGDYLYRESKLIHEVTELIHSINNEISKEKNKYSLQKMIFLADIPTKIINITGLLAEYIRDFKKLDPQQLFSEFERLLLFYLEDNPDYASVFLNQINLRIIEKIFDQLPLESSGFLLRILKVSGQSPLIVSKGFIPSIVEEMLVKFSQNPEYNDLPGKYLVFTNIWNILEIFLAKHRSSLPKISHSDDLKITRILINFSEFLNVSALENILFQKDEIPFNQSKLESSLRYFQVLVKSLSDRMVYRDFTGLSTIFTIKNIEKLIEVSGEKLDFRGVFLELSAILYIDYKSRIVDNRKELYRGVEKEGQWDWDCGEENIATESLEWIFERIQIELEFLQKCLLNQCSGSKNYGRNVFKVLELLALGMLGCSEEKMSLFENFIPKMDSIKSLLLGLLEQIASLAVKESFSIKVDENRKKLEEINQAYIYKRNKLRFVHFTEEILSLSPTKEVLLEPNSVLKRYLKRKSEIISFNRKKNLIFSEFSQKTSDNSTMMSSFCLFFTKYLSQPFPILDSEGRFAIIEVFRQAMLSSEYNLQEVMTTFLVKNEVGSFLMNFFKEIKENIHYFKHQNQTKGIYYQNSFMKINIFLEFLSVLVKNNLAVKDFMESFYAKKTPSFPFINILESLMKSLISLSFPDQNYTRIEMISSIVRKFFQFFRELADDCEAMRIRLFVLNSDLCKNFLTRVCEPKSRLFSVKSSIISFLRSLVHSRNHEIVSSHSTNFEISILDRILVESFRSLSTQFLKKHSNFTENEINAIFKTNPEFSKNEIFKLCREIVLYFRELSEVKSRYSLYFKERTEKLKAFDKDHLVIFRFFDYITKKIEIVFPDQSWPWPKEFYYTMPPETFYLSKETQDQILQSFDLRLHHFVKDLYIEECKFRFGRKIQKDWSSFNSFCLWISSFLGIIAIFLYSFQGEINKLVILFQLVFSALGCEIFFMGKQQILARIQSKTKSDWCKYLREMLSLRETVFLIHFVCCWMILLGWETSIYLDLVSFVRLLAGKKKLEIEEILSEGKALLVGSGYLALLAIIFLNFAVFDEIFVRFVQRVLVFWGISIVIFTGIIPILMRRIKKINGKRGINY